MSNQTNQAPIGNDGKTWPGTMDAMLWAREFLKCSKLNPSIPTDVDTMFGWFANAIMVGYDEGQRRSQAEATPTPQAPLECSFCIGYHDQRCGAIQPWGSAMICTRQKGHDGQHVHCATGCHDQARWGQVSGESFEQLAEKQRKLRERADLE